MVLYFCKTGVHSIENDENTIEAFDSSISLGYEYIETDVQHTKDNKLVIFHDDDLKRICNLNIKIAEINFDELNKTAEGKAQLELAALRAVVAKQQAFIAQFNGTEITAEDVIKVDDTSN